MLNVWRVRVVLLDVVFGEGGFDILKDKGIVKWDFNELVGQSWMKRILF